MACKILLTEIRCNCFLPVQPRAIPSLQRGSFLRVQPMDVTSIFKWRPAIVISRLHPVPLRSICVHVHFSITLRGMLRGIINCSSGITSCIKGLWETLRIACSLTATLKLPSGERCSESLIYIADGSYRCYLSRPCYEAFRTRAFLKLWIHTNTKSYSNIAVLSPNRSGTTALSEINQQTHANVELWKFMHTTQNARISRYLCPGRRKWGSHWKLPDWGSSSQDTLTMRTD